MHILEEVLFFQKFYVLSTLEKKLEKEDFLKNSHVLSLFCPIKKRSLQPVVYSKKCRSLQNVQNIKPHFPFTVEIYMLTSSKLCKISSSKPCKSISETSFPAVLFVFFSPTPTFVLLSCRYLTKVRRLGERLCVPGGCQRNK